MACAISFLVSKLPAWSVSACCECGLCKVQTFQNVFIAVITETFAEIRVQFSEMWQKKDVTLDEEFRQVTPPLKFPDLLSFSKTNDFRSWKRAKRDGASSASTLTLT